MMDTMNSDSDVSLCSVQIKEEPLDIEPESEDFINPSDDIKVELINPADSVKVELINPADNVKVELEEEEGVKLETNVPIDPLANVQVHYTEEASSSEPSSSRKRPAPSTSEMAPSMIKVQSSFSMRDGNRGSSSLDCRNPSIQTHSDVFFQDESYWPIPKFGVIHPPEINSSQPSDKFRNSLTSLNVTGYDMEDLVTRNTDIVFGVKCFSCPFCKHFSRNKGSMKSHIYYKHFDPKNSAIPSSTSIYSPTSNNLPHTTMALHKTCDNPSSSTINTSSLQPINTSLSINPFPSSSKKTSIKPPSLIQLPSSLSITSSSSSSSKKPPKKLSSLSINSSSVNPLSPSMKSSSSIHTLSSLSTNDLPTSINPSSSLSITPSSSIHSPSLSTTPPSTLSIYMSSVNSSSSSTNPSSSSQSINPTSSNIPSPSLAHCSQSNYNDIYNPTDIPPSMVIKKEVESDTESLTDDLNPMFQNDNFAKDESMIKFEPSYDAAMKDEDRVAAHGNPSGECFDGSGVSPSISTSVIEERYEPIVDPSVPSKNQHNWLLDCEMLLNRIDDKDLENSVVKVYGIKCFKCPRCDHLSRNLRQMRCHFISKHTIRRSEDPRAKGVIYKCRNCPFNSTKLSEFKFHLTSAHSFDESYTNHLINTPSQSDGQLSANRRRLNQHLKCSLCSFESDTTFGIEAHMMTIHADLRPFQCKQCHFGTLNKNDFLGHLMQHNYSSSSKRKSIPNILSSFKCKYCDYRSVRKRDLLNHVYTSHPPVTCS